METGGGTICEMEGIFKPEEENGGRFWSYFWFDRYLVLKDLF